MVYAAVISLLQTTEQILNPNYQHRCLDEKQQICDLHRKTGILLDFLERYSQSNIEMMGVLEGRIRDACFAAEDIIESHISNQYLSDETRSSCFWQLICALEEVICPPKPLTLEDEYRYLQKVIVGIDSILEEVMKIKDGSHIHDQPHLQPTSASTRGTSVIYKNRKLVILYRMGV